MSHRVGGKGRRSPKKVSRIFGITPQPSELIILHFSIFGHFGDTNQHADSNIKTFSNFFSFHWLLFSTRCAFAYGEFLQVLCKHLHKWLSQLCNGCQQQCRGTIGCRKIVSRVPKLNKFYRPVLHHDGPQIPFTRFSQYPQSSSRQIKTGIKPVL